MQHKSLWIFYRGKHNYPSSQQQHFFLASQVEMYLPTTRQKASPRISQREGSRVSTPSGRTQCPRTSIPLPDMWRFYYVIVVTSGDGCFFHEKRIAIIFFSNPGAVGTLGLDLIPGALLEVGGKSWNPPNNQGKAQKPSRIWGRMIRWWQIFPHFATLKKVGSESHVKKWSSFMRSGLDPDVQRSDKICWIFGWWGWSRGNLRGASTPEN